jgi:diguanylate cyclase (GGDEF)-like protein/PAS domain S-box-containing protein
VSTGEQWLNWLGGANVAAFVCRRDGTEIAIVDRTPTFVGWPDEQTLPARLTAAWPAGDGSPAVLHFDDDWTCVLQALDDGAERCLGIVRRATARQRYNDGFHAIVEALPDIVARLDRNHRHLYINPAIEQMTGISPQVFIGRSKREIGLPPELVEQWESLVDRVLETEEPAEIQHELPTVHGSRQFLTRVVPEFRGDGELATVLSTSHDITQLKSLQRQLAVLANTDPLTSLLNRRGFVERVEAELSRVRLGHGHLSVLMLDINNFKEVNDRYGHLTGDNVLAAIGDVLRRAVGVDDFVARIGGDEFCVGLVDGDGAHDASVVDRIRLLIRELDTEDGCPSEVSVSIGLTAVGQQEHSVSDLLSRVDQLMYREKSRTRGRH